MGGRNVLLREVLEFISAAWRPGAGDCLLFHPPLCTTNRERTLQYVIEMRAISVIFVSGSGLVVMSLIGPLQELLRHRRLSKRMEYMALCDVVNLSARLMVKALVSVILCEEETQRCTAGETVFKRLDPLKVKGKASPVQFHAAVPASFGQCVLAV